MLDCIIKAPMYKFIFAILIAFTLVAGSFLYLKKESKNTQAPTPEKTIQKISESSNNSLQESSVPLPSGKDIVRTYLTLIDEDRVTEAIGMMEEDKMDDATKQAWGVQFNSIKSLEILDIEDFNIDENPDEKTYKITVNVEMSPESASEVIPYFGWGENPNIRFITLTKESNLWKIKEISTGP